jgi:Secretion system C-terminal sorting domain/Bacterial Ig domain
MKKAFLAVVCLLNYAVHGQIIVTVAGNGLSGMTGDGGMATAATTNYPGDVVVDPSGNIYFSEHFNNIVRKVSPAGILSTVAGNGTSGYSGDGGPATAAQMYNPYGLALDTFGNLYISDCWNYRVRKVTPAGIISTIAGTGEAGYNGDGIVATTATLWNPTYICTDLAGNVYITDNQNQRIRKVTVSTGIITTVAGNGIGAYSGDGGPATAASIKYSGQIAMDIHGTLYIADGYNYVVRKVNSSGIISTIAGTGTMGFSGDGGPATLAQLNIPLGLCADNFGNVYFSDWHNYRIRKISSTGIITTIVGDGTAAYSGDGGPASAAEVNEMDGIHFSNSGNLFIADAFNYRVRAIMSDVHPPVFIGGDRQAFSVCEDTSAKPINSYLAANDPDSNQTETWSLIAAPHHGTAVVGYSTLSTGSVLTPTGLTYTPASGYVGMDSFKVMISDGWFADTTTIVVTVLPLPSAGVIVGPDSFCVSSETGVVYSDSVAGGIWSLSNSTIAVIGATSGSLTSYYGGSDTVIYTVGGVCGPVTATKMIHIDPVLALSPISGPSWVCIGDTVTLLDTFTGGAWSATNSNTSISTVGIVAGLTAGIDTVNYSATNLCGTVSVSAPITVLTTFQCDSALEVRPIATSNISEVGLQPNPATDFVDIDVSGRLPNTTFTVRVLDQVGRVVQEIAQVGSHVKLDISHYAPGTYLLVLDNGGEMSYRRLVKF